VSVRCLLSARETTSSGSAACAQSPSSGAESESKQIGSGDSKWWLKNGDWFFEVMWFLLRDEEAQHYVEEVSGLVLVESVVFTPEELCVTEQTVQVGSEKRPQTVDVLVLAPDSKRMIEDAGVEQFAVQ